MFKAFYPDAQFLLPYPLKRAQESVLDELACKEATALIMANKISTSGKQSLTAWIWASIALQPEHSVLLKNFLKAADLPEHYTFTKYSKSLQITTDYAAAMFAGDFLKLSRELKVKPSLESIKDNPVVLSDLYNDYFKLYLENLGQCTTDTRTFLEAAKRWNSTSTPILVKLTYSPGRGVGKLENNSLAYLMPNSASINITDEVSPDTIFTLSPRSSYSFEYEILDSDIRASYALKGTLAERLKKLRTIPYYLAKCSLTPLLTELTALVNNAIKTNDPTPLFQLFTEVTGEPTDDLKLSYVNHPYKSLRIPLFFKCNRYSKAGQVGAPIKTEVLKAVLYSLVPVFANHITALDCLGCPSSLIFDCSKDPSIKDAKYCTRPTYKISAYTSCKASELSELITLEETISTIQDFIPSASVGV